MKKAVLFLNLGTPKSYRIWDIALYLHQFLTDRRVITLPYILRLLLVQFCIIPKKIFSSSKNYRSIWQKEGSLLAVHSDRFMKAITPLLREKGIEPFFAMRYQTPSIDKVLSEIYTNFSPDLLSIIPLYPQYASATTGSSIEACFTAMKQWDFFPKMRIHSSFYSEEWFLSLWAKKIREEQIPDSHILFCFHGLPKKQLITTNPRGACFDKKCCDRKEMQGVCYMAQSHYMAQTIASFLSLQKSEWSIAFQSRLGRSEWTKPYLINHLELLLQSGVKKVTIVPLSFVADCIETADELDREVKTLFLQSGGEAFRLVSSLNDSSEWVHELSHFIESTM